MNPCDRTDSLLSFFVDNECSPAEGRFVEGHIVACARCRRQHDELTQVMRRVKLLPAVEVSHGFTERVLDEALGRPAAGLEEDLVPVRGSLLKSWGPPLAAAAALAVAGYFGIQRMEAPGDPGAQNPVAVNQPVSLSTETVAAQPIGEPVESIGIEGSASGSDGQIMESLVDLDPGLVGEAEATPLGTQYVLEDWILRKPAGGGDAVLTRVGASKDDRLVVTF